MKQIFSILMTIKTPKLCILCVSVSLGSMKYTIANKTVSVALRIISFELTNLLHNENLS